MNSVLSISQFDQHRLLEIFTHANVMRNVARGIGGNAPAYIQSNATGKTLVRMRGIDVSPDTAFELPVEAATIKLGGNIIPTVITGDVGVVPNLETYADLVSVRVGDLNGLSLPEESKLRVLNAGFNGNTPLQTMAVLHAIFERLERHSDIEITIIADDQSCGAIKCLLNGFHQFDVRVNLLSLTPSPKGWTSNPDHLGQVGTSDVVLLPNNGFTFDPALFDAFTSGAHIGLIDHGLSVPPLPSVVTLDPQIMSQPKPPIPDRLIPFTNAIRESGMWVTTAVIEKMFS